MGRIHNFSAGPGVLPESVLRRTQQALWEYGDSGLGIAECSHRSALFDGVIGDNLQAADIDGDGRVDLVLASNSTNFRKLALLNRKNMWEKAAYRGVLSNALHMDVAVADDSSDAYGVFTQFLYHGDTNLTRTGVVRYPIGEDGFSEAGKAIFFDDDRFDPFFRLDCGDLNGDGLDDVVAARKGGALEVYLQMAGGEFYRETSPELDSKFGMPFDIQIVDLDGDGRDDVIGAFSEIDEKGGCIRVWMSGAK